MCEGGGFAAVRHRRRPRPRCPRPCRPHPRRHRRTLEDEAESRTSHHRRCYFFCFFLHNFIEKSAICGCGPKNPPDDDNKTRLEPYGTTAFGISNPVPSRGHKIGRYTSQTQQDGGWLSDGGHGIITKYLPEGEAKFSRKG